MDGVSLEKIETQDQMYEYFEYAYEHIISLIANEKKKEGKQDGQKSSRNQVTTVCRDFFDKIIVNLNSGASSPKSKLMSLRILVEFLQKRISLGDSKEERLTKFYSCMAAHKIINVLGEFAEQIDPNKAIHLKGVNNFPKQPEIGKQFIRIVLQLIKALSLVFPTASSQTATSFKKKYDQLLSRRVIFPEDFAYITAANNLMLLQPDKAQRLTTKEKEPQQGASEDKRSPNRQTQAKSVSTYSYKVENQIDFHHNKIESYISTLLDENDSGEDLELIIKNNHMIFQSELKKTEKISQEVIASQDTVLGQKFFKCNDFMNEEAKLYKVYLTNSHDPSSYITMIRIFAENHNWLNSTPTGKPEPPAQKVPTFKNIGSTKVESGPAQTKVESGPAQTKQEQKQLDAGAIKNLIGGYFSKLQQKSKSPMNGFRAVYSIYMITIDSLSQQKANLANNVSKSKRNISPLNKSNALTKSIKSLRQSKIAPIFMNVPNLNPPPRRYQGRIVSQNYALARTIASLHKSQGIRRFMVANFKNKSSLFENEHIQIGYKSQPIYDDVQNFHGIINIELFVGNITQDQINKFSLQFKGDNNVILYANPKIIQTVIPPAFQNKQQLMIVPLKAPFPLLVMTARYIIKKQSKEFQIVIPNSVLKLASYMSIGKSQFADRWSSAIIIRTEQFKLSRYIPPDTFVRWFPSLKSNTEYERFAEEGSTTDYELFCSVIILKSYQSLLKINVRPNLTVVIQLAMEDRGEEAESYFKFYLQSLQQFIKEVE